MIAQRIPSLLKLQGSVIRTVRQLRRLLYQIERAIDHADLRVDGAKPFLEVGAIHSID